MASEDSDSEQDANLGNKLFESASDAEEAKTSISELHKISDPVLARAMLAQDSPEL
jgi:U3 small nucleolar RNA-associated protein 3